MQQNERFYFRVGECLSAIEAKNTARALLKKQVNLLYPKNRKPTPEEHLEITAKLRLVQLGVEKKGEGILDYKIRKQKECRNLIQKTATEFPEFKRTLYAIIKERSKRRGEEQMAIQRAKSALTKSLYELICLYCKGSSHDATEISESVLKDLPNIKSIIGKRDYILDKSRIYSFAEYQNDEFEETVQFIYNNPEYLFSKDVLTQYEKILSWKEKTNERIVQRLVDTLNVRFSRFKNAYESYYDLIN